MYNKICFCITNEQYFSISVPPSDSISDRISPSQVLFLVSIVLFVTLFFSLYEEICHTHLHDKFLSVVLWELFAASVYCCPLIVHSMLQFLQLTVCVSVMYVSKVVSFTCKKTWTTHIVLVNVISFFCCSVIFIIFSFLLYLKNIISVNKYSICCHQTHDAV